MSESEEFYSHVKTCVFMVALGTSLGFLFVAVREGLGLKI